MIATSEASRSRVPNVLLFLAWAVALLVSGIALGGLPGIVPSGAIIAGWSFVLNSRRPRAALAVFAAVVSFFLIIVLLLPAVQQSREASRWTLCKNNLKEIGLALHNYHDFYGSFPPAFSTDADGRPLLSWRVLILPYLDSQPLYERFHLDEPWNSPHNHELLREIPRSYRCPGSIGSADSATTYVAVIGDHTAWPGKEPRPIAEIVDGTLSTILVIEYDADIPWTEPSDVSLADALDALSHAPPLESHGHHGQTFLYDSCYGRHVLLCDGSARFAPHGVDRQLWQELLTIDDGEPGGEWDFPTLAQASGMEELRTGNFVRLALFLLLCIAPLPWVWIRPTRRPKSGDFGYR